MFVDVCFCLEELWGGISCIFIFAIKFSTHGRLIKEPGFAVCVKLDLSCDFFFKVNVFDL